MPGAARMLCSISLPEGAAAGWIPLGGARPLAVFRTRWMEERLSYRFGSSARSIAVAALGVLVMNGTTAAQTDTTRSTPPFTFRKSVVPSTEYLARILENARARRATMDTMEAAIRAEETAASELASAAEYAERYGISRDLARTILKVAHDEGVDPDLAFRLVRTESRFVTRAVGPAGALGLTQLMPSTARSIDRSVRTRSQIIEPTTNLRLGFRYLRGMIERYDGNVKLGLLAYNRGEVAVDRALRSGRDPENGYSHRVLGTRGKNPYRGKGLVEKKQ